MTARWEIVTDMTAVPSFVVASCWANNVPAATLEFRDDEDRIVAAFAREHVVSVRLVQAVSENLLEPV